MVEDVRQRRGMILVIVVAVAWWIVLGILAALTSNPVMVNRDQVRTARLVLEGSVTDTTSGQINVRRHWLVDWISPVPENPTIDNIGDCFPSPQPERLYLFPLIPTGEGTFRVVPLSGQPGNDLPLIYPADESAVRQLEDAI